jgi:hypothetical protein
MPQNNKVSCKYNFNKDQNLLGIEDIHCNTGAYILENTPPPPRGGRGKYQPMSFGGKNMKRGREKGENVKEKEERGKRKKGERK